jgi:hypothetical protein
MSTPSFRDRIRPVELLALSAGLGVFAGLVVLVSTRDFVLALIFLGIAFIVTVVVLAMLALAVTPTGDERLDIEDQDREQRH